MVDQPTEKDLGGAMESPGRALPLHPKATDRREDDSLRLLQLVELACNANTCTSLDQSLRLYADQGRSLLDADACCIALVNKPTGYLTIVGWSAADGADHRDRIFPIHEGGIAEQVMKDLQGAVFTERGGKPPDALIDLVFSERHVSSALLAPVRSGPRCMGLVYAFTRGAILLPESRLGVLSLLGHMAGTELDRRKDERDLRESEERFRFMAETTGDVLYRLRYDTMRYDYMSPGILKLTGYDPEEIESIGFSSLVQRIDTPGQPNVPPAMIKERRLEGKTGEYRADYLILKQDGSLKWVRDHSFPWMNEKRQVIGSVGILSDVSDYKRSEARIRECVDELTVSEQKYRTLVERLPLVVYRVDPRGEILFLNPFFQQVFGYATAEILHNPDLWIDSVYEDDRKRVMDLRKKSYEEGRDFFAEYRVVHRNGDIVYIFDHAVPYRGHNGQVAGLDGIIVDMTGRVKIQEELLRTQGMKTISEVSARLAHEIRNPLVSAGGFARLLLAHMSPEDPNRLRAEIIIKEVSRLEAILRMILSTLQPLDLQFCSVDLNLMLQSIARTLAPDLRDKDLSLEMRLSPGAPLLSLDPHQMERALEAILRNALHQCRACATISISTRRMGKVFAIGVKYPARHLSSDDIEHFFYPFTTLAVCENAADLPLSKIIINKHGGNAVVMHGEDGDVSIEITLPLDACDSGAGPSPAGAHGPPEDPLGGPSR